MFAMCSQCVYLSTLTGHLLRYLTILKSSSKTGFNWVSESCECCTGREMQRSVREQCHSSRFKCSAHTDRTCKRIKCSLHELHHTTFTPTVPFQASPVGSVWRRKRVEFGLVRHSSIQSCLAEYRTGGL